MTRPAYSLLLPVLLLLSVSASVLGCGDGTDAGEGLRPPPADLTTAGAYEVVSSFDLTASALIPDPANSYLQSLRDLRRDPASTLFRLVDEAGVPLVGDLLGVLPGAVEDRLKGWINEYVFGASFQGSPITTELDALVAQATAVLTTFDLASDFELSAADAMGQAEADHHLRELRYRLWGGQVQVQVPLDLPLVTLPGEIFVTRTTAAATVATGRSGADAQLTVGDHSFGIPYGRLAWIALNQGSTQRYGAGVRATLGVLFDCPALAASVARQCVLGVCVGHAAEIAAICERGLDEVANDIKERIEALDFNAVRLERGDAAMWDTASGAGGATVADRRIDRLDGGKWKAAIDIGMGPRPTPASFRGARR